MKANEFQKYEKSPAGQSHRAVVVENDRHAERRVKAQNSGMFDFRAWHLRGLWIIPIRRDRRHRWSVGGRSVEVRA